MAVYTVHARTNDDGADLRATPERLVFVRDGFYVWAVLLSGLWLIWHRLWLALIGYLVLSAALEAAMWALGTDSVSQFVVMAVIALLLGLEGGSLRRWKLSRRKWRQLDIVVADSEEAAERRFFERRALAAAPHRSGGHAAPPLPRASLAPAQGIVGLFPEPGASR
jgi:hypothetical protein